MGTLAPVRSAFNAQRVHVLHKIVKLYFTVLRDIYWFWLHFFACKKHQVLTVRLQFMVRAAYRIAIVVKANFLVEQFFTICSVVKLIIDPLSIVLVAIGGYKLKGFGAEALT